MVASVLALFFEAFLASKRQQPGLDLNVDRLLAHTWKLGPQENGFTRLDDVARRSPLSGDQLVVIVADLAENTIQPILKPQ
jgi:hypothetical protein